MLYEVTIRYNVRLTMRDGVELSANLFMPVPRVPDEKFPAILEMIPYRKDDWRYNADHVRMTYFAQRGYVGCRLDIRGTGSSEGLALDEYTSDETRDGYEAVEWLAAQAWCNGNVGMWGISYGGFTSIQVAKLRPPHLKAIIPMYATDDRYLDDVHYVGGCMVVSEVAQYAVSQIAMNAMPPKAEYARGDWAKQWKERLENTPPWTLEWLRQQTDGAYWRNGSLAPEYDLIHCAIFHIAGWMDGYTDPAFRMQAQCANAPRKVLCGNWVHSFPDSANPGPNLDYLHEMVRFFDYWLKGVDNGVMAEPPITLFRREYTPPEAFPARFNGEWVSEAVYPIARTQPTAYYLGDGKLSLHSPISNSPISFPHQPTHGTQAGLCWGAGLAPNGLARDLRPAEATLPTYTSEPLTEPLDFIGVAEAVLHLSSSAPVAHVVVRLTDVAPDGTSALVTAGILNLTHRNGHARPEPLTPGEVVEVRVPLKVAAYRFLPGHRLRVSLASAYWPVIWPSPYKAENVLLCGPATPSRLVLPVIPSDKGLKLLAPPAFKTTPAHELSFGSGAEEPPVWQIIEDVINRTVTVKVYGGDSSALPDGRTALVEAEAIEMTAYADDPARVQVKNEVNYRLTEHDVETHIRASGTLRSDEKNFHAHVALTITLNGQPFFERSWLETIPRQLN